MDTQKPKPSFQKKFALKMTLCRKSALNKILNAAGIRQVRGHLICTKELTPDSVVIDLGANEGLFSKEIHESFGSVCYAVEPNKTLYNNIQFDFINKFNYAITASDGPVDFYISNNNEASSIIKDFEVIWGNNERQTIDGITFVNLVSKLNIGEKKIEILKIDIEGAELELIESLDYEAVRNIKQITIEFHDWINEALHERTVAAIKRLTGFGFDAYTDTPNHKWPVEMLFLNRKLSNFDPKEKFALGVFRKLAFLNYC